MNVKFETQGCKRILFINTCINTSSTISFIPFCNQSNSTVDIKKENDTFRYFLLILSGGKDVYCFYRYLWSMGVLV